MAIKPWSDDESRILAELLAVHPALGIKPIARRMHCSATRIRNRLTALGIKHAMQRPAQRITDPVDLWWLGELCAIRPALSWEKIARHFSFSRQTIQNECPAWGYRKKQTPTGGTVCQHPERNAKIIELAKQGFKGEHIAQQVGVKRSVVAGVCGRAGVSLKNRQDVNVKIKLKAAALKKKPAPPIRYKSTVEAQAKAGIWRPINGRAPVPLDELDAYQCRWPLWEHDNEPKVFCGCKVDEHGWHKFNVRYCDQHYADSTTDRVQQYVFGQGWRR